jgi:hypothetical protein
LRWTGETAAQIPAMTLALVQRQLLAEWSTAAWQDYFLCNGLLALIAILPALLVEKRLWQRWWRPTSRRPKTPPRQNRATRTPTT